MLQISDIAAVLKKIIVPQIQNQLRKESVLYDKIQKNVGVTISNNTIYIAARSGRHSGIYSVAEGVDPRSGKAKYQQPSTNVAFAFGTLELTDQAIEAASDGDKKAVAAILSTEVQALKDDIKMDFNRQMHGAGTGQLCKANGSGAATTALVVNSNVTDLDSSDYLIEGMYISIGGGAAVQISTVNSATSITLATAATWNSGDVIKKADASEMMGLAGLIDDGTNVTTIQNILRSSNPWANSFCDNSSTALTEADMIQQYIKTIKFGGAKVIFMGETMFRKYGLLLTSLKKTYNLKEVLSGGWKGLEFMGGDLGVMLDADTWSGYVQFVDFEALTIAEMSKAFQWLEADAHGGILRRSPTNKTVWEGTLKYYANVVAKKFRSSAALRNRT